jgi:hypothetical protein
LPAPPTAASASLHTKIAAENSGRHSRIVARKIWLRGRDLNPRPSGYEPDELPGCSTPHFENNFDIDVVQSKKYLFDGSGVKKTDPICVRRRV